MKKILILSSLIIVGLFSSGCATWDGVKKDSADAWDKTKEVSTDAWENRNATPQETHSDPILNQ